MKFGKKIFFTIILTIFMLTPSVYALNITQESIVNTLDEINLVDLIKNNDKSQDLDPTVDLMISVKIKEIRAFDKIDKLSTPDFYVKVIINEGKAITSDVWRNQIHVSEEWST